MNTHTPATMASTTPAATPAKTFPTLKAFVDACAQLRYVAIYPVCWGTDPAVYRTQLRGTQAAGYTCVLCDGLPGDTDAHAFVEVGSIVDTPGHGRLYQHTTCPNGDTP